MDFKSLVNRLDQLSEAKKTKQEIDEETKETPTGRVHKAKPGGYGRAFDTDEEGDEKKDDKKAEPAQKRGRGRPKKDADETGDVKKWDFSAFLKPVKLTDPKGKKTGGRVVSKMADADKADAKKEKEAEKASKKTKLKDWIDYIDENMLAENEQITVQPAKSNTQVIKQGTKTLGTVSNPQLAQQIKQSIGKGEMSLAGSELGEDAIDDANLARKKMNMPASQRKAQGGNWKVSQQDLEQLPAGTRTTSQGLAAHAKRQGLGEEGMEEGYSTLDLWNMSPKEVIELLDAKKITYDEYREYQDLVIAGGPDEDDDFDYTDYTMRKGEQGVAEGFNYKQVHSSWSVHSPNKKEFNTPYRLDQEKEARAHAERIGGKLVKIDQRGHSIRTGSKADKGVAEGKEDYSAKKARAGKDIGKPGKQFAKIAKTAGEKYGSEEKGKKVAGAVLKNLRSKTNEADIPSDQVDMGAGLGAGRSSTTLEGKKAKPDYIDLDKDGNKKESMKKAAQDKKKKVTESSHRHSAAKLLGKSHALAKEGYNCRFEDMDEARLYHEGYKEGLDECYGQGVYEMAPPATVPGMASAVMSSMEEDMFDEGFMDSVRGMFGNKPTTGKQPPRTRLPDSPFELDDYPFPKGPATQLPPGYIPPKSPYNNDLMDSTLAREGNAFTGALAKTPKGGKFSVGGKTFTDTSDLDEMSLAFESLDKQLKSLLESEEVSEGMTVSISKGQQGAPDSVSVTAQDAEADQLLGLIKHAGLGLFGDDQQSGYSASDDMSQAHGDIKVVGDHDGMMSIMKKISGIEDSSNDYEDEESYDHDEHGEEEVCETCNEAQCQCEGEEPIQEVETEDQMAFNVSEDDSEEKETTADEDAEAEEDEALARQNSQDDEEDDEEKVDESYANSDDDTFEADINFMTKAISGGLNKQKSTGQTTIPVIAGQNDRMGYNTNESIGDWKKLAGLK